MNRLLRITIFDRTDITKPPKAHAQFIIPENGIDLGGMVVGFKAPATPDMMKVNSFEIHVEWADRRPVPHNTAQETK